jgi:hypothetical protein
MITATSSRRLRRAIKVLKGTTLSELEAAAYSGLLPANLNLHSSSATVGEAFQEWSEWAESVSRSQFTLANYRQAVNRWMVGLALEKISTSLIREKHLD